MFDRMHLRRVHDRLLIRGSHTQIEGCDRLIADRILSGNINPGLQLNVVNGKTCDLFHDNIDSSVILL